MKSILFFISFISIVLELNAMAPDSINISSIPYKLYWENSPLNFVSQNNSITITAGKQTDLFRAPDGSYIMDNAPRLLFKTSDDFVLSASIHHAFKNKWDAGAIIIKSDSLNYVKYCFEKDYTGTNRVVSVVTKGVSDDCNSIEVKSNKIFYKVAKSGNVVLLYCSEDGSNWYLIRNLQFISNGSVEVGFLAQSPTGEECEVKFENVNYQVKTVKDPFTGE